MRALGVLLLAASLLNGCASTSQITALTQQFTIEPDGKWLIYAQTPEPEQQALLEQECVAAWQQAGLYASATHNTFAQPASTHTALLAEAKAAGYSQLIIIDNSNSQLQAPQFSGQAPTISATRDESGTRVLHFAELSGQARPHQQAVADIYPLNGQQKAARLQVNSHEANNLKRISRSQCKALANFIAAQ